MFFNNLVSGVGKCCGILVAWLKWLFTGKSTPEPHCTSSLFRRSKATYKITVETTYGRTRHFNERDSRVTVDPKRGFGNAGTPTCECGQIFRT